MLLVVGFCDTVIPALAVIIPERDAYRENTVEGLTTPEREKYEETDADSVTPSDTRALLVTDTELEIDTSTTEPLADIVDEWERRALVLTLLESSGDFESVIERLILALTVIESSVDLVTRVVAVVDGDAEWVDNK